MTAVARPQAEPPAPAAEKPASYLRVTEQKNKSIALDIATRTFERAQGQGPKVGLVSVAHIADGSFFTQIQEILKHYDVVLYESVKPPGAGGAGGDTPQQRIESTRAAMRFIGGIVEAHQREQQTYPADLNALQTFAAGRDVRLEQFVKTAAIDGWGRSLVYTLQEDGAAYELKSLGGDGAPGGEDENADLVLEHQQALDVTALAKEDNLQSQLASALSLEFQLTALKYDQPNWRCSDMAMDEVSRRLAAKGIDFGQFGGTLAGSSFSGKMISMLLGLMRAADRMMDGAIADMFKVVLVEMLGNEEAINQAMVQFGKGFGDVIISDRNQVAIDDLKRIIEREPQVKSVAILYGAAHMPDMAQRLLDQLGYEAAGEQWVTAITVDFTRSAVSPAELNRMRQMVRQMMQQTQRRGSLKRASPDS